MGQLETEKKKTGRPSKLGKIDLAEVERLAGLGLTDEEIALVLDVALSTLKVYKKNQEFLAAIKKGKTKADAAVVSRLYKNAMEGDTTAQIFWLKNRQPDKWRDKRDIGLGGNSGEGISLKIEVVKVKDGNQD